MNLELKAGNSYPLFCLNVIFPIALTKLKSKLSCAGLLWDRNSLQPLKKGLIHLIEGTGAGILDYITVGL